MVCISIRIVFGANRLGLGAILTKRYVVYLIFRDLYLTKKDVIVSQATTISIFTRGCRQFWRLVRPFVIKEAAEKGG